MESNTNLQSNISKINDINKLCKISKALQFEIDIYLRELKLDNSITDNVYTKFGLDNQIIMNNEDNSEKVDPNNKFVNTTLNIMQHQISDLNFIKSFRFIKIGNHNSINVSQSKQWFKEIRKFASESIRSISSFRMNELDYLRLDMWKYILMYTRLSSRVRDSVWIYWFYVTQKQFATLFVSFKHCEHFSMVQWIFNPLSKFRFGSSLAGANYKRVIFSQVGHWRYSCWGANPHVFDNIIDGFAQEPSLLSSLTLMRLFMSNLGKQFVIDTLNKYGFGHVTVQGV